MPRCDSVQLLFKLLSRLFPSDFLLITFTIFVFFFKFILIEIFTSSTGNISDIYSIEITPAGWTFSIWGIIYVFQALWIIYVLISICRPGIGGGPLYKNPVIVSALFLVVYSLNMGLNITWLIVWDRMILEAALGVLVLITLTLYVCLVDYHIRINHNVRLLAKDRT